MNPNLYMHQGGVAQNNDFSAPNNSQTTNHIYLQPGSNQGEFESWMQRIGSLLQVGSGCAHLRPVLELIVSSFQPDRLFVIHHDALPELGVEAVSEILVVLKENCKSSRRLSRAILDMACFNDNNVIVHFEIAGIIEQGIEKPRYHYGVFCKEANLVFSNTPYRLPRASDYEIEELKTRHSQRFENVFRQANMYLSEADLLVKKQLPNMAALMLQKCLAYTYKNILFEYSDKLHKTQRISKLQLRARKFFPQTCSQISENTIWLLDEVKESITAPLFNVEEVWDAKSVFEEVEKVLNVMKATLEKRINSIS